MAEFPIVEAAKGSTRQVLTDHPDLMLVVFKFETGAVAAMHNHPHVQSTYVQSGRFRFTLGDELREVGPGEGFVIQSGITHGCECLEAGTLVDSFTPRREDFL